MTVKVNNSVITENYRTIACVSLNKNHLYNDFLLQTKLQDSLYTSKKHKTTLKFYNTDICNDIELSYVCRSVDIVVLLVIANDFDEKKISLIAKNIPSYVYCCLDDNTKFAKKYVEKNFGGDIVKIRQVIDRLCCLKIQNTKIRCSRPTFFIDQISYENDGFYYAKAILQNTLIGNRIIINGIDTFDIVEINNKEIQIIKHIENEIFEEKNNNQYENNIGNDLDNDEDLKEQTKKYEDMEIENDTSHSTEENNSDDNESCYEEDLIEKYKNYYIVNNLKTGTYVTKEYPKYYNSICLYENINEIEKKIEKAKEKEKIYVQTELKLKRITQNLDLCRTNAFVCYNTYNFEGNYTIYNMEFNCFEEVETNCEYIADFGHVIIPINVLVSNTSNGNLHKCVEKLKTGVITFIAPMTLNVNKILLFKNSFTIENMIGYATNNNFKERIILEEGKIVGKAKKIDKRYCTVTKMFNNKEEVLYYRNMSLTCKNGNTGIIKKPIGTYGLFKAYFCKPVTHEDKITIKLYKRIFPIMPKYY